MAITAVNDVYEQHIRALSVEQRLQLLARIAAELAAESAPAAEERTHTILELDGLGKEIWEGIDAQEYVNTLRAEWDERKW